jgi:tRNA uridine 5-carboxymethylaminomethyl modification enzyme
MTLCVGDVAVDAGLRDSQVIEQVEIQARYQGYIERQQEEVAKTLANEETRFPEDFDFRSLSGLSSEVRQKLVLHRPQTLGQASRIQGVTPAAISILLVHLKRGQLSSRHSPAVVPGR